MLPFALRYDPPVWAVCAALLRFDFDAAAGSLRDVL